MRVCLAVGLLGRNGPHAHVPIASRMVASPLPRRSGHAALLMLQRLLAEADRSLLSGNVASAEEALSRVGLALDLHRRQQRHDDAASVREGNLGVARRFALHKLTRLLTDVDAALVAGDLDAVRASLEKAKDAVEASRELDESSYESGVRTPFPSRSDKYRPQPDPCPPPHPPSPPPTPSPDEA